MADRQPIGPGDKAAAAWSDAELGDLPERYHRLVEQAPDAILVHVSGVIVLANAAAVCLAGVDSADDLVGRRITDFLLPPYLKSVVAQVLGDRAPSHPQAVADQFRRVDGTAVAVEVTAIPFVSRLQQPAAHLVIRDVSEREKARDAEQVAASQLRLLLSQLPALVFTTDLSLHVTSLQGRRDELLAASLTEEPLSVMTQQRALLGISATVQADFRERWLETHVEPLYDPYHALVGCLGLVQDVTVRKSLEAANQAGKDAAVGALAGGVAHEVNNMMAVVLGFADLLLESATLPRDLRGDVQEIRRAAERATTITSQLLAFSRRGTFQPAVVRLDTLLANTVPMLQKLLGPTRSLQLRLDHPPWVKVDVGQFELVLVNLAINARDAMPAGGTFTIAATCEDVTAAVAHDAVPVPPGTYAVVRIRDTGIGMAPEVLEHIFEPFFTTKSRGAGTGLGLAAVHGILERNGIPLAVESTPGEGTTFTLYMPIAEPEADERATEATGGTARSADAGPAALAARSAEATVSIDADRAIVLEPPEPALDRATVLVVDDETAVRTVVCRGLTHHGYRVLEASSGEAALALLEREGPADAALLDLTMPGMDGAELALQMAQRWPDVQVMFMSGHTEADVAGLLARFPGSALLHKPFTVTQLVARVGEMLAGWQRQVGERP